MAIKKAGRAPEIKQEDLLWQLRKQPRRQKLRT